MLSSALLTTAAGVLYSYSPLTTLEAVLGVVLLASAALFLVRRKTGQTGGIAFGLALGKPPEPSKTTSPSRP